MVLQHHPDKRKAKGEEVITDDDYFTCITKAYEILGRLTKIPNHVILWKINPVAPIIRVLA